MSEEPILAAIAQLGAELRGDITKLGTEVGELRTGLMSRMDRLQARIDQLGQEAFVGYAQHEGVRRHSEHTRTELRDTEEKISGLLRQVRMLRDRMDGLEGP